MKTYVKSRRAQSKDDYETWIESEISCTINAFDGGGDARATVLVVSDEKDITDAE